MPRIVHNLNLAEKRKLRVRGKLSGSTQRPRLTVFRSNKHTYLQAIDDVQGKTVAAATSAQIIKAAKKSVTKLDAAKQAAESIVKQLQKQNISAVVFDRGSYKYHGRVKAVADTLRAGEIQV